MSGKISEISELHPWPTFKSCVESVAQKYKCTALALHGTFTDRFPSVRSIVPSVRSPFSNSMTHLLGGDSQRAQIVRSGSPNLSRSSELSILTVVLCPSCSTCRTVCDSVLDTGSICRRWPMWRRENRGLYERMGVRYPSDLTDHEWALIAPLIPPAKRKGGLI